MKFCLLVVALSTVLLSVPVSADTTYYVGGNVSFLKYENLESTTGSNNGKVTHRFNSLDYDLTSFGMRFGAQFHPDFSAEFRIGFGLNDDDDSTIYYFPPAGSEERTQGLEIYYGGHLRAGAEMGRFYPYLLIGWTAATVEDTYTLDPHPITRNLPTDFSYGIGADIRLNDAWAVNSEWGQYLDTGSYELSGFRMGLVYSFSPSQSH